MLYSEAGEEVCSLRNPPWFDYFGVTSAAIVSNATYVWAERLTWDTDNQTSRIVRPDPASFLSRSMGNVWPMEEDTPR